jgi:hypothetical protein
MATITITQVYLEQATAPNGPPINQYWNTNSAGEMSIDSTKITAVSYVWDTLGKTFIPGIIQIYLNGILQPIYSTNSYASIVAYMNPVTP